MGFSRRHLLGSGLLGACALAAPGLSEALTVRPRMRLILDNDFSGDPDGLFQLAHHLASPSVDIRLIVGSHIHVRDFLDGSDTQADNAVARVEDVFRRMQLDRRPPVVAGRNAALPPDAAPQATPAVSRIIAEAMRTDTKLPLVYAAGAGLTDLAAAVRLKPEIGGRLRLVWIGGMEYPGLNVGAPERHSPEYNLTIDLAAARTIFNDSDVEIWQVPRNVYRQMIVSCAELTAGLRPAGALGQFLLERVQSVISRVSYNLGETYILGDSPLVTLTALQSSFDADTSSSACVVQPTPRLAADGRYEPAAAGRPMRVYTAIDARLTFADMFAKFAAVARQTPSDA